MTPQEADEDFERALSNGPLTAQSWEAITMETYVSMWRYRSWQKEPNIDAERRVHLQAMEREEFERLPVNLQDGIKAYDLAKELREVMPESSALPLMRRPRL